MGYRKASHVINALLEQLSIEETPHHNILYYRYTKVRDHLYKQTKEALRK